MGSIQKGALGALSLAASAALGWQGGKDVQGVSLARDNNIVSRER